MNKMKWFFYSLWIKLTCKMPSRYVLRLTFPKKFTYTNLVQNPTDLTTLGWDGVHDTKINEFDELKIGQKPFGLEQNTTIMVYEYHDPKWYNFLLKDFNYVIKNSRITRVKCVYDSQETK